MPAPLAHILNPVDVSPRQATIRPPYPGGEEMNDSAALSYKRVTKACTQCRRDKSRCDRARPCDGCVKKGRVDSCIDGCVACRQGRLSCDEGRPCLSCLQDGRECVEDDPAAIAASRRKRKAPVATTTTSPRPIKPHPRVDSLALETNSKYACFACRRDNKKCAGGVICHHCAERGERCMYVGRSAKQRCALCRKKNKKCEHGRPCLHCVRADVPCVDLPRKGIGRGLRVKRACAGCRADKIQCEESRPCGGCRKKKVDCVDRVCEACSEMGEKCSSCRRQDHFHFEGSETSSNASYSEEENDNISIPSMSSPASSFPYNVLPLDPRHATRSYSSSSLLEGSRAMYGPVIARSHSLDAPRRLPSLDNSGHYSIRPPDYLTTLATHPTHPNPPLTPLTSMPELPSFSVAFPPFPFPFSAPTSNLRTHRTSNVPED